MTIKTSGSLAFSEIEAEFGNGAGLSQFYRGGSLVTVNNTNIPTGGAIKFSDFFGAAKWMPPTGGAEFDASGYRHHVFTTSGTFNVPFAVTADVIVVAGGGGGGDCNQNGCTSGGGGAGGVVAQSGISIVPGSYLAIIGAGATGNAPSYMSAQGGNSSFGSLITAIGGGTGGEGGGDWSGWYHHPDGSPGGCGGGGGGQGGSDHSHPNGGGGAGTSGQGYDGQGASGTGGAGGSAGGSQPGQGIPGSGVSFYGYPATFAIGGFAWAQSSSNYGANSGNGGSGRSYGSGTSWCGNGCSGIVIVRYKLP